MRSARLCNDFIVSDVKAPLKIEMTQQDIDNEKKEQYEDEKFCVQWDGAIEFQAVLRKLTEALIDFDILLIHGAAVCVENQVFLFTADSGTGKTTHVLKWIERLPNAFVINGDKPYIRINNGEQPLVSGSPWAGKENMYVNTMKPLKAIILMDRAEKNRVEKITYAEAFSSVLQQTYQPEDEEKMRKTLKLLKQLSDKVSFWRFQFNNFNEDCFDVAYSALVKE